ncbi:MAG: hypothetical protein C4523_09130 [Myxococcales bacterium]|nr:MAG: hypothetical protein C4523_09130 [Myxococcales bacterium]
MRLKLGLVVFGVILIFSLLTNFYIIGTLESDSVSKLEQNLVKSYQVYATARRATQEKRLDLVRKFAKEQDFLAAMQLPATTDKEQEERHFKLFEQMEVLSRVKYFADTFIVVDADGQELARTLVATWRKNRFSDRPAVKAALSGETAEDILLLDDKIAVVSAAPIVFNNAVIGAVLMANVIDEALARQENELAFGEFAFFSRDRVLASTMSSAKQMALDSYVRQNAPKIARVLLSKNDYFEERLVLGEERYIVILSPIDTGFNNELAGFMLLTSQDDWLSEYVGSRNFLFLVSLLLVLLGVSSAFYIIQKAYNAIDFILEGAHQIIVGNKEYQFSSEDPYLNQLGQTMNLMIAILLGKYIPEEDDENTLAAMRGSLDSGRAKGLQDKMLIQNLGEASTPEGERAPGDETEDLDGYYDRIYEEFIREKRKAGEDISQITKARMIVKLKRAEETLKAKHGCASVRFSVKEENGKVTLKPTPIWKK